jgi:hypothetical protein
MPVHGSTVLGTLEQWSPVGFIVGGLGFLLALVPLLMDSMTSVAVPEIVVSVVVVPTMAVISLVALPGFYRYVADGSPRLAFAGFVAAAVAAASITLVTVGKVGLDLLGIVGFTEEGPLVAGFFLWMLGFFLSMLLYGLASIRSGEPSRVVGLLLLVVIVEPGTTLLNDVVGLDLGIVLLYATLAVAGGAFLGVGYLLRSEHAPRGAAERATDPAA